MMDEVSREQLLDDIAEHSFHHAPDHLLPLAVAQRSGLVSAYVVFPRSRGISLLPGVGAVVTLFDRRENGVGPSGFVQPLIDELLAICAGFVVIGHGPHDPKPYALACSIAAETTRPAVIVETTPRHEDAWAGLASRCNGRTRVLVWSAGVDLMSAVMAGSA